VFTAGRIQHTELHNAPSPRPQVWKLIKFCCPFGSQQNAFLRNTERNDLSVHSIHVLCSSFVKQSHYRPRVVLRDPGGWGSQNFKTVGTWRWLGCQPYAPAAFTPQEITLVLIYVSGWVDPSGRKDYVKEKIPMTPSGIEPPTFRFIAQCLRRVCIYNYEI
jgi:hypothetical protein